MQSSQAVFRYRNAPLQYSGGGPLVRGANFYLRIGDCECMCILERYREASLICLLYLVIVLLYDTKQPSPLPSCDIGICTIWPANGCVQLYARARKHDATCLAIAPEGLAGMLACLWMRGLLWNHFDESARCCAHATAAKYVHAGLHAPSSAVGSANTAET